MAFYVMPPAPEHEHPVQRSFFDERCPARCTRGRCQYPEGHSGQHVIVLQWRDDRAVYWTSWGHWPVIRTVSIKRDDLAFEA